VTRGDVIEPKGSGGKVTRGDAIGPKRAGRKSRVGCSLGRHLEGRWKSSTGPESWSRNLVYVASIHITKHVPKQNSYSRVFTCNMVLA
jgi:hypothetical protein